MNWRMAKLLNKIHIVKWVILILVIMTVSGCSLFPVEESDLSPPLVEPVREHMQLYEVVRKDIKNRILGTAVFEPIEVSYYQFSSGGLLKEVHIKAGQQVKKGDLLIERDVEGLDLTLKQRRLEVAKKERDLNIAKEQKDTELINIRIMELEIAKYQLNKTLEVYNSTRIIADRDGQIVFLTDLRPGDQFDSSIILVSVADTSQMMLSYQPSNIQVMHIEFGMNVDVTFNGQNWQGKVIQTPLTAPKVINPNLSSRYGKRIFVQLDKFPADADFGKYADIEITLAERLDVLTIPISGLRSFGGRNYVQILDGESRKEVDVLVGLDSGREVEIIEGVEEGQLIILK